jgi:glycine cleavage system aminomethyltransferase T
VTALAFLSPQRTRVPAQFRPVLRSPLHRRLQEAGAEFEERNGWLLATRFPHEHELGVRDISHLGKLEVRGDVDLLHVEGAKVVPITSKRALVVCDYVRCADVEAKLRLLHEVWDVTGALAGLDIAGPGAETLMRRVTAHDLDDLPAAASVSHVGPCVLVREGVERFLLFFPQEYGHYLWEVVVDAAEPLGGGPKA